MILSNQWYIADFSLQVTLITTDYHCIIQWCSSCYRLHNTYIYLHLYSAHGCLHTFSGRFRVEASIIIPDSWYSRKASSVPVIWYSAEKKKKVLDILSRYNTYSKRTLFLKQHGIRFREHKISYTREEVGFQSADIRIGEQICPEILC